LSTLEGIATSIDRKGYRFLLASFVYAERAVRLMTFDYRASNGNRDISNKNQAAANHDLSVASMAFAFFVS
jgi:hypothetical protein